MTSVTCKGYLVDVREGVRLKSRTMNGLKKENKSHQLFLPHPSPDSQFKGSGQDLNTKTSCWLVVVGYASETGANKTRGGDGYDWTRATQIATPRYRTANDWRIKYPRAPTVSKVDDFFNAGSGWPINIP